MQRPTDGQPAGLGPKAPHPSQEEEDINVTISDQVDPFLPPAPLTGAQYGMGGKVAPQHDSLDSSDADSELIDDVQFPEDGDLFTPFLAQAPLKTKWNPYPLVLLFLYIAAAGFYFFIRIAFTLKPMGNLMGYGIFIMCVEMLGLTAMLPYAVLLIRSTLPTKTKGLPTEEQCKLTMRHQVPHFKLHVLIPCYKEPSEVVSKTVKAALQADIPVNCTRTIYLCDDAVADSAEGARLHAERSAFIDEMDPSGQRVQHIKGRIKVPGEGNGKSNNVNNCLQNHIFSRFRKVEEAEDGEEQVTWLHDRISSDEVVVIFDSDMVCNKDFFCKILEVMADPSVALCLTPQAFTNTNPKADVFNNVNFQFWEYWLPGSDAQGYIACTGTNFCIRARPLAHAGWFPTYTITEDYALGMELKRRGYVGKYLLQYLVYGEAPDNIRNVFRQRSRWCKGHMQVFFSKRCPLLLPGLPFAQRLWYSYGTWCYFVSIVTIPVFMVAPILALIAGITPLYINRWFAAGATAYYAITFLIQNYCRKLSHLKGLWFANISNTVLWFTYTKAVISVISSKMGLKVIGFKATVKKGDGAPQPPMTVMDRVRAATRRMTMRVGTIVRNASLRGASRTPSYTPVDTDPLRVQPSTPSATSGPEAFSRASSFQPGTAKSVPIPKSPMHPSRMVKLPPAQVSAEQTAEHTRLLSDAPHDSTAPTPKRRTKVKDKMEKVFLGKSWRTVKGVAGEFKGNYRGMEGTWDLFALFIILLLCLATFSAGVWRLANISNIGVESYANIGVPMMWALYNAIPAYLFIHYCFDKGASLETASSICQLLQGLLGAGAMAFLWVLLPNMYNHRQALQASLIFFQAQQSGPADPFAQSNVPWLKASGENLNPAGGWYANGDHIHYTVPVANAAAMLAWTYLQFPKAFNSNAKRDLLHSLRHVGSYISKCYIEADGEQRFVYRIGDPRKYTVFKLPNNTIDAQRFQPAKLNATWTSPDKDLNLQQAAATPFTRQLFKTATSSLLAADVLGSASGALAAIATVFKKEDPAFAEQLLAVATKVYDMQAAKKGGETSACMIEDNAQGDGPCWVREVVKVRVPFVNATAAGSLGGLPILCWVPDWIQTTCVPAYTKISCAYGKVKGKNFLQPTDCCSYMQSTNIWNGTTPKGICSLPGFDASRPCYVQNLITNTCDKSGLDMATGTGCGGAGQSVFPSASLCCNDMALKGRFTSDRPAHGECAPNYKTCFIPSLSQGACIPMSGINCTHPGLENTFEEQLGCCDYLTKLMQQSQMGFPGGVCKSNFMSPPPPPAVTRSPPRVNGGRRLFQANSTPRPSPQPSPGPAASPRRSPSPTVRPPSPPRLPFLEDITTPQGELVIMEKRVTATFYNSTYILDDMAWGGAWLYKATGDPSYLGDAEYYLEMHQSEEIRTDALTTDAAYYISNWDNMAWATRVLLADITKAPKYTGAIRTFFNTWIGNAPRSPTRELYQRQAALNATRQNPGAAANSVVMPDGSLCTPTASVELKCNDGLDDDCNGLTDEEDLNCPFKPVKYMDKLAWTPNAPLPNAANAAYLALTLGSAKDLGVASETQKRLKCWALGQVDYILGEGGHSYLVGYGDKYPKRPQHRAASCSDQFECDWGNFYSGAPNPHVLTGALVAGPDFGMPYLDDRTHPSSRVAVDYTAPLVGALAGIIQTKINVQECSQWQGLIQNVFSDNLQV